MFFKLVKKSSQRNRRENSLFFVSLIISIVAFYIILSLENQDVIIFLKTMESDAISRLFQLIPALYIGTLVILFFLVYFSGKYQMERRSHEFGMYLMMGMRRSRLFLMLLAEEIWSSLLSIIIGIPIAVFLSEIISLVTAKLVGLGIIGHHFTLSGKAVLWTIIGYCIIRFAALILLSGNVAGKDIVTLMIGVQEQKHRVPHRLLAVIWLADGIILLALAYGLAIMGISWASLPGMGATIAFGLTGTFLLFRGISLLFDMMLRGAKSRNGLAVFNFRQLQESMFFKPSVPTVASLLVLIALCCFGYGVSVSMSYGSNSEHVIDYTFENDENAVREAMASDELAANFDRLFAVKTGIIRTEVVGDDHSLSIDEFMAAVERQSDSTVKRQLLNNLQYMDAPYLIDQSGYNEILSLAGKEPLNLGENQLALYINPEFYGNCLELLSRVLEEKVHFEIDGESWEIVPELYENSIVTDRTITLSIGLIVPDKALERLTDGQYSTYWNGALKKELVSERGLMQAIIGVNALLDGTSLNYESYLKNIGRQLFYMVAASYTTIYLAIIFLIIANTVIGVQFLMQQQKTKKRYQILLKLGCSYELLCRSARRQICWYYALPVGVAAVSSFFGIRSLFTGIATAAMRDNIFGQMAVAIPVVLLLLVVEWIYVLAVMRMSDRRIAGMMTLKREDD